MKRRRSVTVPVILLSGSISARRPITSSDRSDTGVAARAASFVGRKLAPAASGAPCLESGKPGARARERLRGLAMKQALEILSEMSAAAAALLWLTSARIRLRHPIARRGLGSGLDDPKALLRLVYEQSRWSAWAAVAAAIAAVLAMADGLFLRG